MFDNNGEQRQESEDGEEENVEVEKSVDDMWDVNLDDTVDQYNEQLLNHLGDADKLKKKFEKYMYFFSCCRPAKLTGKPLYRSQERK